MDIGIGLPATIPGVSGQRILEWARRADEGPFSSLGIIDRIVYPNFEPMVSLAAAAGATSRVRLMSTVVIAPVRSAAVLAKQAASLDAISGGRFTLGVGLGGREDDYIAAGVSYHDRGRRFEQQLAIMKGVWAGEPIDQRVGPVGPPPARKGGPELLIGGYSPRAISRVGKWGDGFIAAGAGSPEMSRQAFDVARESWKQAGRPGSPRLVAGVYYALGPNAAEEAARYIKHYYGYLGEMADMLAQSIPSSLDAVKDVIRAFDDMGADELVMWPCRTDLDQVDRLADLIG